MKHFEIREEATRAMTSLVESQHNLSNFHSVTMEYVEGMINNAKDLKLDKRVFKQLKSIKKLGDKV